MEDTLEHHGVKGMKWGIRRNRKSIVAKGEKKVAKLKKKGESALSVEKAMQDRRNNPRGLSGVYRNYVAEKNSRMNRSSAYMTTRELKRANTRMALESNYNKNLKNIDTYSTTIQKRTESRIQRARNKTNAKLERYDARQARKNKKK